MPSPACLPILGTCDALNTNLTLCNLLALQAFARLSAVYGGTYMLHKSDAKVEFDESGKAVGVSSEGETAKCKFVVGDGSYFPGKTRLTSRVVRALCVLSHPIPNTDNAHSAQIILPQQQIGRKSGEEEAGLGEGKEGAG
jgi:RAB protein geranylgeranyltransferase component A